MPSNLLILDACIVEVQPLRYTPAGVPALNLVLDHSSEVMDAGNSRLVNVSVKAVAFGAVAERLTKQAVGSAWKFSGFLSNARKGKSVVFNVQDFSVN